MDTIREKHRVKARKSHICDYCEKPIRPGEEYTVATYVADYIYDWHECDRCKDYVSECWKDYYDDGEGMSQDYFQEFMRENHPDVYEEWRVEDGMRW